MEIALSTNALFSELSVDAVVKAASFAIIVCISGQARIIAPTKKPSEETR